MGGPSIVHACSSWPPEEILMSPTPEVLSLEWVEEPLTVRWAGE
jgi:hypothetical protein